MEQAEIKLTPEQRQTINAFIKAASIQLARIMGNEEFFIKRLTIYLKRILWYKENPNMLDKDIADTRESIEVAKARIQLAQIVKDM